MTGAGAERRRSARAWLGRHRRPVGASVIVLAVIGVAAVTAPTSGGGHQAQVIRVVSSPPSTGDITGTAKPPTPTTTAPASTTTTTIAAPTTTTAPTTVPPPAVTTRTTAARPTTTTTAAPVHRVLTGRVTGANGAPVSDAYLIGLHTLAVTRTDAAGNFSMPCPTEPLVVSSWLLPIDTPGPHPGGITTGVESTSYGPEPSAEAVSYAFTGGTDTPGPHPGGITTGVESTSYGPEPSAEAVSYAFTGGTDLSSATTPACDGVPLSVVLPASSTVQVTFVDASGAPSNAPGPLDNLYFQNLGAQAGLETAPVGADGTQVLGGLAPGVLTIDGATASLTCSGPGVTADPAVAGATVAVAAGQTIDVTCST